MENNACVVTERVSISFHEISSGSKASSLLFFFSCGISWHCTKSNRHYFSEESIKTTIEPLFFWQITRRESVGGKTLMNVQNLFFSSNFELCFVSAFSGKCCCQYAQNMSVSFGESFINPTLYFQSLPFQTVLKRSVVKRRHIYSGTFWDSGHICSDHVEKLIPAAALFSVQP